MKNKLILSLLVIFVLSCSTDSISEDTDTTNFEATQLDNDSNLIKSQNTKTSSSDESSSTNIDLRTLERNNNLINDSFNNQTSSLGENLIGGGLGSGCEDFTAPGASPGPLDSVIDLFYNTSLALDEINCVRQEIFEAYGNIRLYFMVPGEPYHDVIVVLDMPGPTSGSTADVRQKIEDNPDTCLTADGPCMTISCPMPPCL